ncbi:MAG TPA: hypothetical protein VET45_17385 [Candidatus Binatia bacterium]|nr:hypothetical protein [Candidatus Binatia bacterium]
MAGSTPATFGYRDADGYYFLVDRVKDMINAVKERRSRRAPTGKTVKKVLRRRAALE